MQHSVADIGKCIYCFRDDIALTDEHIIPQGLGGRHFLARASCEDCAKRTSRAEQEIMQGCTWPARVESGMKGKGKKLPEFIRIAVDSLMGRVTALVRPKEMTVKAFIPTWPGPEFMTGQSSNGNVEGGFWLSFDPNVEGNKDIRPRHDLNLYLISKAIAKIAYCTAIAKYGLGGAQYFIPDLVLAKEERFARFVGCAAGRMPKEKAHHWSDVYEFAHPTEGVLLLGRVRLFGILGAPIFHVVIGRLPALTSSRPLAFCVGDETPGAFTQTVKEMEKASADYALEVAN